LAPIAKDRIKRIKQARKECIVIIKGTLLKNFFNLLIFTFIII